MALGLLDSKFRGWEYGFAESELTAKPVNVMGSIYSIR